MSKQWLKLKRQEMSVSSQALQGGDIEIYVPPDSEDEAGVTTAMPATGAASSTAAAPPPSAAAAAAAEPRVAEQLFDPSDTTGLL
eukprot:12891899-Prorocentrum_lima.AAC.1